jgi:hypothetical protein
MHAGRRCRELKERNRTVKVALQPFGQGTIVETRQDRREERRDNKQDRRDDRRDDRRRRRK